MTAVIPLGTCRGCGTLHPYGDLIDHDTPLGFSVYLCASCYAGECTEEAMARAS